MPVGNVTGPFNTGGTGGVGGTDNTSGAGLSNPPGTGGTGWTNADPHGTNWGSGPSDTGLNVGSTQSPPIGGNWNQPGARAIAFGINSGMPSGELQTRWSQFVTECAHDGGAVDPNALVQWVLRESYMQTTEDLRFYAEKVKYFNTCKKLVRDYLQKLRDYDMAMKTSLGKQGFQPPPSLEKEPDRYNAYLDAAATYMEQHIYPFGPQKAQDMRLMQTMLAEMDSTINDKALTQNVEDVIARANERMSEKFGLPNPPGIPTEIQTMLRDAWQHQDKGEVTQAMTKLAQFISYCGDCGLQGGVFGAGPGTCNDANHLFSGNPKDWPADDGSGNSQLWQDFNYYMDDSHNAAANSNLASGDIQLLCDAFGWPGPQVFSPPITGGSSVEDVVRAAMSMAGNEWANEIKTGVEQSTQDMYDIVAQGFDDPAVRALLGPELCAKIVATSQKIDQPPSMEEQAFGDLGLPPQIPNADMIDAVRNGHQPPEDVFQAEIKKWEEKLNSVGDDAQLANVDLQNVLQKQQQTLQMMSNISKMLYDTAQSVIRKIGG